MKVVILGSGQMLKNLIAGCMDAGCNIVGVFRYDKVRFPIIDRFIVDLFNPSSEYTYIKSHKLYEIKARSANSVEFKKEILKLNADIILVGTWGEKIKKPIFNLPKLATINVHPSLLPKYRGPNPYLQVIKNMEKESGVTFHLMDENFDTGAILLQKHVDIESSDTGTELRQKIVSKAREEKDVMLDFSKSAEEISAHIRSFHPWFKCYFSYKNQFFIPNPYELEIVENNSAVAQAGAIVTKSHTEKSLTVLCGDNKLLKMSDVKLYGFANQFFTTPYIKYQVETKS